MRVPFAPTRLLPAVLPALLVAAPVGADPQAVPDDARGGPHAAELPAGPSFAASSWPARRVWRPLLLDRGMVELRLGAELGVGGEPASVVGDLWVGVNRTLTLGLTHSSAARDRVGAGRGLCLSGAADDPARACAAPYDAAALDARFFVRGGGVEVVGRVAVDARSLRAGVAALEVGAVTRWRAGDVAVLAAPTLALGILRRDLDNRERARLPVTVQWQATPRLALEAGTGLAGPVAAFFGELEVSARAAAVVTPRRAFDLGVEAGLPDALRDPGERYAGAWLAWRR